MNAQLRIVIAVGLLGVFTSTARAQFPWAVPQPPQSSASTIDALVIEKLNSIAHPADAPSVTYSPTNTPEWNRGKLLPRLDPPDQMGTRSDVPSVEVPRIELDTAFILSQPDLATNDYDTSIFHGDVFQGHMLHCDDGILFRSREGNMDPGIWIRTPGVEIDPGMVLKIDGNMDPGMLINPIPNQPQELSWSESLRKRGLPPVLVLPKVGTHSLEELTYPRDSSLNYLEFKRSKLFGSSGPDPVDYVMRDGKRYFIRHYWPDDLVRKQETRVPGSSVWLIGEGSTK